MACLIVGFSDLCEKLHPKECDCLHGRRVLIAVNPNRILLHKYDHCMTITEGLIVLKNRYKKGSHSSKKSTYEFCVCRNSSKMSQIELPTAGPCQETINNRKSISQNNTDPRHTIAE